MPLVPIKIRKAIKRGRLTESQLTKLIDVEARVLGLSTEEAIERASTNTLPRHYVADDLSLLVKLLQDHRSA